MEVVHNATAWDCAREVLRAEGLLPPVKVSGGVVWGGAR